MKEQNFLKFPFMSDLKVIAEQNNTALKNIFKGKIKGWFLIDVKEQVLKALGFENLIKYYDFGGPYERIVTGVGEAAEYDICRMIVGIHKAQSIFLSESDIRKNEKSKRYRQRLVSETIEKIKFRRYGSVFFRKVTLLQGEEFLYYPLPYELFVMLSKIKEMLSNNRTYHCCQLYYGILYNSISALSLLEGNLLGAAYPLCRGALEMYFKLLILAPRKECYNQYEKFREFEIQYSCDNKYPHEFKQLFEKRMCNRSKATSDFLHFGWVDYIDEFHKVVKKFPYSVYGIITFLKIENEGKNLGLECLEGFYKSCHAYTHGSIQIAKYPVLHYFEISIMLYLIIRQTFLLLCGEQEEEPVIEGQDIIPMIDRDFEILYNQYQKRSTESFEEYYHFGSSEN